MSDETSTSSADCDAGVIKALRAYAEFCDQVYEADPSDYNAGRADAATEAINRAMRQSGSLLATVWEDGYVTGMADGAGLANGTRADISPNPYSVTTPEGT